MRRAFAPAANGKLVDLSVTGAAVPLCGRLFVQHDGVRICLWFEPPSLRHHEVMHGRGVVRHCGFGAIAQKSRRRCVTFASTCLWSRVTGFAKCGDYGNGLSPSHVGPVYGASQRSGPASVGQASLQRGELWRGQSRWPAEASWRHVCPRGCGVSLRG